jgi:phage terminase small subunit
VRPAPGDANQAKAGKLRDKQAAFVREYLVDKNATQAAIRAGYSPKTARSIGEENLSKPDIRAAIDAGLADLASRVGITAERVLRERARIAFFDPRKLLDAEGNPVPMQDLDDDTAAAIAGVEVVEMKGGEAIPGVMSYVKKYRLAAKDTSLAALEKYLGLNEKPMRFALPPIESAEDCTKAQAAVLTAVAAGQLMLSEAKLMSDLIDAQRKAYETHELAKRLEAIEEAITRKEARP